MHDAMSLRYKTYNGELLLTEQIGSGKNRFQSHDTRRDDQLLLR